MKRLLSGLLTLCFLCAGWGMQAAGAEETARAYSEKIFDLPEGYSNLSSMSLAADGTIAGAAQNKQSGWDLLAWNEGASTPEIVPLRYDGTIDRIDIAPDGQVMAVSTNMEGFMQTVRDGQSANLPMDGAMNPSGPNQTANAAANQSPGGAQAPDSGMGTRQNNNGMFGRMNIETTILWFEADGTVGASFTLNQFGQDHKALSGRKAAAPGLQSAVAIYDETGAIVRELEQSNAQSLAATDEILFVIARDAVYAYDIESGEQIRSVPLRLEGSPMFYATPDGTLYFTGSEGVFRIGPDADQAERVMDTVGTLIGDPSAGVTSFGVKPDGSIVALVGEGGTFGMIGGGNTVRSVGRAVAGNMGGDTESRSTLVVYSPIDASLVANRETFLITALRSSNRLRKAVSDFQRAHPELKVVLQVQLDDDGDAPVEDHIRTLNTDLLAGKGGDVIILDGLPMAQYAARGILKDVSSLLPELNLLPGIASGLPDEAGRVFSIPAQFSFQTLWGRKTDIELVQSLMDVVYANISPDQAPMSARTPEELLRLFFPSSEASLRDEQGKLHFNTPEFEEFLDALYALYANQGEQPAFTFPNMGARMGRGGLNIAELLSFYNGATAFFSLEVSGLMQISAAYSLVGGPEGSFIPLPSIGGVGRAYTPSMLVGVNSTSKLSDLAIEFVRTMFSGDVQELDQMNALPATVSALNKMFDDAKERSERGEVRGMMMIPGGISLEMWEPDGAAWDALKALCLEVDTPATMDETLFDFILSETENFFEGWGSAADAGQAVEQRAFYYLNE